MTDATDMRWAAIEQFITVGRPERAEELARRVLADDPEQPLVLCLLGEAQLAQGRPAEAQASAERAVALAPLHPETHRFLAVAAVDNGEGRTAVRALETAVGLAPGSAAVHQTRAQVLLQLGRKKDALEAAYACARLAPDHGGAAVVLAACLLENRQLPEAEAEVARALRLDPDSASAQGLAASIAVVRGRDDAVERGTRALRMQPADAHVRRVVVGGLQSEYPVVRALMRYSAWISGLPTGSRWAVRLAPFFALRVLSALHTTVALVLAVPIVAFIVVSWTAGPMTLLLLLRRRETRKYLARGQRRVAVVFGVMLSATIALAAAAAATADAPFIAGAFACGIWTMCVGGYETFSSRFLRRLAVGIAALAVLVVAGAGILAAVVRDTDPLVGGCVVALVLGVINIWVVAAG